MPLAQVDEVRIRVWLAVGEHTGRETVKHKAVSRSFTDTSET